MQGERDLAFKWSSEASLGTLQPKYGRKSASRAAMNETCHVLGIPQGQRSHTSKPPIEALTKDEGELEQTERKEMVSRSCS